MEFAEQKPRQRRLVSHGDVALADER